MKPALALIRDHRLAQIKNGAAAAALMQELGRLLLTGKITRNEFIDACVMTQLLSHRAAVRLAGDFLEVQRSAAGVDGEMVEDPFDAGAAYGRAVGTMRDLDAARASVDRDWETEFWRIIGGLGVAADAAAKNAGRNTIIESADASGRRWRRVSDGNPCAFCAMLVGRGPVYTSGDAAGQVVGRGKNGRTRGTRPLGATFHPHCGCSVVEQIGPWTPTAEEEQCRDLYHAATDACDAEGLPRTAKNVQSKMRELGHGIVNDAHAPKTETSGAGGGTRPPRRGAGPFKEMGDPPPESDRPAWLSYWLERQNAIPVDFKGDILKAGEVQTVERLVRRGELIDWIRPNNSVSANDFLWLNRGSVKVEMKSPKAKYTTIRGRIHDAVKSARVNHGVVKDSFLVDIGGERLTPELAKELQQYNIDRSRYRIDRLWVLSRDGQRLDEIDLK